MHSDHYQGLSNSWNAGPIYCSKKTKYLLLNKFPLLKDVRGLDLYTKYSIPLNPSKSITIDVTLFDANHIAGSVMLLFEGYFGKALHTGDFRFDDWMLKDYTQLFPHFGKKRTTHFQ
jgi:Cft2 family RNA processing exonuclease